MLKKVGVEKAVKALLGGKKVCMSHHRDGINRDVILKLNDNLDMLTGFTFSEIAYGEFYVIEAEESKEQDSE